MVHLAKLFPADMLVAILLPPSPALLEAHRSPGAAAAALNIY